MGVQIDEARADHPAGGVQFPSGLHARDIDPEDADNVPLHTHRSVVAGVAGAVDDQSPRISSWNMLSLPTFALTFARQRGPPYSSIRGTSAVKPLRETRWGSWARLPKTGQYAHPFALRRLPTDDVT